MIPPDLQELNAEADRKHARCAYPGDTVDNSPGLHSEWQKLDIKDPSDLANMFDPFLNGGVVTQHPWQIEVSELFGAGQPTAGKPLRFCLCAANSSGKDKYAIAPFAVWFCLTKIQSRCIITSASGNQLSSQTENYIRDLCEKVNNHPAFGGQEIFRIRQRYIKCNLSGSEIRLFATDEAGKAEGYHPMTPVSEMAIIINEAKSVGEDIFEALTRCSGYNYWLEISSPGAPVGHFHRSFTDARLGYTTRKVTSYDCPHITKEEIDHDIIALGEHSALFRSKHLAEFTSLGGQIIISQEIINKCLAEPVSWKFKQWKKRVGIDIAAGGDETTVVIVHGNKIIAKDFFRETDTTITARRIDQFLSANNIPKDHEFIFSDDGGVGHAVIDMLESNFLWNINRVHNQSPASAEKKLYGNKGAQGWYRVARLFEENMLVVPDDELLMKQLTTRYYRESRTGMGARLYVESKKEAKANGRPSPDRVDAYILCFTDLNISDFQAVVTADNKPAPKAYSADELDDMIVYKDYKQKPKRDQRGHLFQIESKLEYANN